MAVFDQEPTPTDKIEARLHTLLNRARDVKQGSSIEPPLAISNLVQDGEHLALKVLDDADMQSNAFEVAAKRILYANLVSSEITDPSFVAVWNLLDIVQYCGDRNICSPQLVLLLIEELLDGLKIDGCKVVLTFLESRREAIIANSSQNKNLVILRSCNELLRRLSRAEDAVFCGRVYIFLFQSFPLGDKSSVNLRGNFHVENVTTFEDHLPTTDEQVDEMEIEHLEPESKEEVSEISKTDDVAVKPPELPRIVEKPLSTQDIHTLYPVFWSLQNAFSNPPSLFEEENFKHFQKSLEATLEKFKQVPLVATVASSADLDQNGGPDSPSDVNRDKLASTFNPKYLTSRDLFKLELSDLAFQRHILVQTLVLIDFLLTLTERSKSRPNYVNAQKAMQYAFTLGEEQTAWALGIKNTVANYLQDGPDGKFYYRMVDTVLSRDKNWVRWKMENCKPFTRDRVPTNDILEAKSGAEKEVKRKTVTKPFGISSSVGYLSNTAGGKGLAKLKVGRYIPPSVDSYGEKNKMIDLDLEMVTSEAEKRQLEGRKTSNTWRALRLASTDRLSSFDSLESGKGVERLFQPVTSIEAAAEDNAATDRDGRDGVPQEQHQSVEEQRAGETSQVTADTAAAE
ncbi:nuclear matrix protein-like protein [Polyplosphaeria fusca]|uniref:Nuclear matrix protein-like protein n=1 Tax=Polyplosphaeria fusca TaxID=682080 RepID=A0A9P4V6C4_9PLEO|nr:nuclear matrix protein-like protein [Polyplosphaeria fusca]